MKNREITYTLTKETTRHQTGFFAAVPDEDFTLNEALAMLRLRPLDDFLHRYVLYRMDQLPPDDVTQFLEECETDNDPVCRAVAAEYLLLTKGREHMEQRFSVEAIRELSRHTPLIYLRSFMQPDQSLHRQWITLFRENLHNLEPLPSPHKNGLPSPIPESDRPQKAVTISDLAESFSKSVPSAQTAISPGQTADIAEDRLKMAGIELEQLMRHESSLSPIGLLRAWRFATSVYSNRNRFSLSGEQTSYGRGLTLDAARASLMMEIVERCCAFASMSEHGLGNFQEKYPIQLASFSELVKNNEDDAEVLNPAHLSLEVSYQDQPLHWVRGETPSHDKQNNAKSSKPIWVPVQCLFLFCNLDELSLFSSLGSTGFASGNTMAQAKVSALLEIIERHQVATVPYHLSTCFQLVPHDSGVSSLLEAYRYAGIHIWFQDITPLNGIPCCRCFVKEKRGEVHVGAAARLDARQAIISAITETTCPFPNSLTTEPAPENLTLVGENNLPDYSTNNDVTDLELLESLFLQNTLQPCYVDLTRADIGMPVVKAIVPGLEVMGDFDDYSRVHPDIYYNYLEKSGRT